MALSKIDVANMVTGAVPVANGGTALTSGFVNGGSLTMCNQWRISGDFTDDESPIANNLEQVDTDGYGKLGGDMTVSSGTWTFPATGIYLIQFECYVTADNIDGLISMFISTTTDNSSFSGASQKEFGVSRGSDKQMCSTQFIFDVTNTTTHKVKFNASTSISGLTCVGNTGENYTTMMFVRLGDT